jgi:transposase-like protein
MAKNIRKLKSSNPKIERLFPTTLTGVFSNCRSTRNCPLGKFYLALQNISQKWTMPIRDWKAALNRLTIQFDDWMPQH